MDPPASRESKRFPRSSLSLSGFASNTRDTDWQRGTDDFASRLTRESISVQTRAPACKKRRTQRQRKSTSLEKGLRLGADPHHVTEGEGPRGFERCESFLYCRLPRPRLVDSDLRDKSSRYSRLLRKKSSSSEAASTAIRPSSTLTW
jgi:hypothetical protein